jgi:hypothetical protein
VEENKFSRLQWTACDSLVSCCCVVDVLFGSASWDIYRDRIRAECGLLVEGNEREGL